MNVLRIGSRGPEVKAVQTKLNARLSPSSKLVTDSIFGGLTRAAVLRYQRENWLVEDGEVGPCTYHSLFQTETYAPILQNVPFIPQPSNTTCWAASTAMITSSSVAAVIARTPRDLIAPEGGLRNFSDTEDAITGGRRFAAANGLRMIPPMSWAVNMLRSNLSQGPLMFNMLWDATGYTSVIGSPGHMIAVVGIRGDDDPSGKGTTLRIHDPWKPNIGKRYSVGYFKWI